MLHCIIIQGTKYNKLNNITYLYNIFSDTKIYIYDLPMTIVISEFSS